MISRGFNIRSFWLNLVVLSASWSGICWHQCCSSTSLSLLIGSDGSSSSLLTLESRDSTLKRTSCGIWFAEAVSVVAVTTDTSDEEGVNTRDNRSSTRNGPKVSPPQYLRQPGHPRALAKGSSTMNEILLNAGRKGLGGGIPGAIAGVVQVMMLMWIRTVMNYQSRYGTSFFKALHVLYKEGGIRRFYRGVGFALVQAPLTRFVSTASNEGVLAFLASFPLTQNWGPGITTAFASIFVGIFRILLMPVVSLSYGVARPFSVFVATKACEE